MEFEKLRYTVKVSAEGKAAGPLDKLKGSTRDRDLLHDVSGKVDPGSVLAILGPSGAGKTTLLNMLTLEKKGGVPQGHIRVDGVPFTLDKYNETAASVEQFDTLWASLTVMDHLKHAVRLYQPQLDADARDAAIQDLMKSVGLEDQQDVKAGNEFMRGLSGGNKRRLSIAVALAKRPSVLFLDEPTSGIDSASAVMIMSTLKKIAEARSIIIVCTIHQPPASVFAGFDNCMVLSMGRVAYFGKADSMGAYFASVGNTPPPDTNIAEFVLDLVNTDFTPEEGVHTLLDKWSERGGKPYNGPAPASGEPVPAPKLWQGVCWRAPASARSWACW
jgi:ABC-type multidrug transport system ATPase subunit